MINNLSLTRLFSEDNQEAEDFDLTPKPTYKHISVPVISPAQTTTQAPFAVQIPPQVNPAPIETHQLNNQVDSSMEFLNAFGEEVSMSPLSLNGNKSMMQVSYSPIHENNSEEKKDKRK